MNKDQIQIEYFKSIREENRSLGSLIQRLWRYKFAGVAIVIVLGFIGDYVMHSISGEAQITPTVYFMSASFIIAPVLAFIIDLKMLEAAMYMQITSEHLNEQYADVEVIQDFEGRIWEDQKLAFRRTLFSFALSPIVSVGILIMSLSIYANLQTEWTLGTQLLLGFGGLLVLGVFVALFILVRKFLKRRND